MASRASISPKLVSLALLTFQNSALIILMHYSRIMPLVDGQRYLPSTAVLLSELFKLAISLTVATFDLARKNPGVSLLSLVPTLSANVFSNDSWKMAVPAALYTLQNTLQYISCSNLDASTFQITYQLKILTTAVFSVLLLGRRLSSRKWLSLILLTVGVALVQAPGSSASRDSPSAGDSPEDLASAQSKPKMKSTVGFLAVLVACFSSGLAGVSFEKTLKETNIKSSATNKEAVSVWIRNVQLSFYSLFPAFFIGVQYNDGNHIARYGFFAGYNSVVWSTIALQAIGGVIVAMVINYSNNIGKGFATSISIIISFIASMVFFDLSITFPYLLGAATVLSATWLYNVPEPPRVPALVVEDCEKQTSPEEVDSFEPYYDEPVSSPLLGYPGNQVSTSRPGTPATERHSSRTSANRNQTDKREE